MIFAFINALGNAVNVIGTKLIYRQKEVNYKNYLSVMIIFIAILAGLVYAFFRPGFPEITLSLVLWFALMSVLAFGFNSLYFYALSKGEVCDIEQIDMTRPLFTVILAALIFPSEREIFTFALTIIAAFVLVISRVEKKHLKPTKATIAMFGYISLVAIETQVVKILLESFHPISFYAVRVVVLAVMFNIFLKPKVKELNKNEYWQFFLMAAVVVVEYLARFYAIQSIGIVKTSLVFLLAPVLILLTSKIFLKEKLTFKKAIADVIIVVCVATVFFIN